MKKLPPLLLLLAVIFVFSACSDNSVKIYSVGNDNYFLVSDKIEANRDDLMIKDSILINKMSGAQICDLHSKPLVFLFSDLKSNVVALPMSRQLGAKLGINGNYFFVVDTITDNRLINENPRKSQEIIEAFTHPGEKINLSGLALVSYQPGKFLGSLQISQNRVQFMNGEPKVYTTSTKYPWPMIELVITALMIFLMARTVTKNCLGIEDWKQRHKLSFLKWKKVSNQITAGLWIILLAFEFTDVIWGTISVSEGVLASVVLIIANMLISVTIGTILKAVLTLPYQAITWFVFTALIVWGIKAFTGHVWQIYIPFTGYFIWLIWLRYFKRKSEKINELVQRLA